MKRIQMLSTLATFALVAGSPALAGPGGGHGGGHGGGAGAAGSTMGGINSQGSTMRDMGRVNAQGAVNANARAVERANPNSAVSDEVPTGTRIRESSGVKADADAKTRVKADTSTRVKANADAMARGNVKLTGVTDGMTVVDSTGATVGTVTNVSTKGNGGTRSVQVTLTDGRIITLSPNSLSLDGNVLTTTSLDTNVKSQGAAHANINGLINSSPNSALSSAGVTTLTGLNTGLTVNNSAGTGIGTVSQVFTNRSGAVVGIQVDLDSGGSVIVPATSLSMNGSVVTTNSTQF